MLDDFEGIANTYHEFFFLEVEIIHKRHRKEGVK